MGKSKIDRLPSGNLRMHSEGKYELCMPGLKAHKTNMEMKVGGESFFSNEVKTFAHQVSGHMNDGKHIGMMCSNGRLLKPADKLHCFERETKFYEELTTTKDKSLLELKDNVPKYYGNQTTVINDQEVDCMVLEDLTKNMKEPCVMDVKIGKRTWDPLASYNKIIHEEQKYHETKRDLGFCITGFQVYKVSNGKLCKFGKEFGKNLNKDSVIDAFKVFLNGEHGFNRTLLIQLLASLWRIQHWARKQRRLRLYSSSLLIMYDARRLRQCLEESGNLKPVNPAKPLVRTNSLYRPLSLAVLNGNGTEKVPTGFSGQLTHDGPILKATACPRIMEVPQSQPLPAEKERKRSTTTVPTLKRTHSFQNNYDKDLQTMKRDYAYMLDDLVCENKNEQWANVKMIDFAHTFEGNDEELDTNYLEGVDSLVKIFEQFFAETDYS